MTMTHYMFFAAGFLVVFFILYNSMIVRKNEVENALSAIHVYLKKRFDLIPNLVASVKTYMKHEEGVLTELTQLRSRGATAPATSEAAVQLDGATSGLLGRLMVSVENYPDLKANENFINLQKTLHEIEEQLSAARRTYNAAVTRYNNGVEMIPYSLVSAIMGLKRKPVFQTIESERKNHDVGQLFKVG